MVFSAGTNPCLWEKKQMAEPTKKPATHRMGTPTLRRHSSARDSTPMAPMTYSYHSRLMPFTSRDLMVKAM